MARPTQLLSETDGGRREAARRKDDTSSQAQGPSGRMPNPSLQSLRGLDWFIFFLADVQTGFGPFIAVYLTTQKWTQAEIGFVLSISGIISLVGQMPGGAIVDAARSERLVAAWRLQPSPLRRLAMPPGRSLPSCWRQRRFTLWQAASSGRQSPQSASDWSGRLRSANGSDATPASRHWAMASPRP